jgi:hypothetical protein
VRPALIAFAGASWRANAAPKAPRRIGEPSSGQKQRASGRKGVAPERESALRASDAHAGIVIPAGKKTDGARGQKFLVT